jgi:iron complex outermembrane receptor protein
MSAAVNGLRLLVLALACLPALGQTPERRDSVVVTGSYDPVPLEEADRSVRSLPVRKDFLTVNTWADFLRLDPSLDLRARAPNGVQTDLSIRGATFGQTLVLLNGMRLNDAQSGHHNLDIPVPLESVSRIEVLRGAGSTLYGADAVGGVVNFLTRAPETTEVRLRAAVGNFGVNQQRIAWTQVAGKLTQQFAVSRDFSSGFRPNRDYRNLTASSLTHLLTRLGPTDVVLAHSDRPFGADQFYGNYPSWERTRTWYASLRQGLGATQASFAFRRHTDLFVLYRDRPEVFTNRHAVESFQAAVRRRENLSPNAAFHWGFEAFRDSITSNNLGRHARGRGAGYAGLDVRALRRFSFSLGARQETYGAGQWQFSPSLSGGFWLSPNFKFRAGASRAFRIPSFTDLYYHDPANLGSPDLRPEKAWSLETGLEWNAGEGVRGDVTVFQRRERDGIDYVRRSPTDLWRAANIQRLRMTGLEANVRARVAREAFVDFGYTALHGVGEALGGLFSRYVFNYPSHTGVVSWHGSPGAGLLVRTRLGVTQRLARDPYPVWDVGLAWSGPRLRPFVQCSNLSETRYEEIQGVAMPGRALVVGIELMLMK